MPGVRDVGCAPLAPSSEREAGTFAYAYAVTIDCSGETLAVGAPGAGGDIFGVNSDQGIDGARGSGVLYLYYTISPVAIGWRLTGSSNFRDVWGLIMCGRFNVANLPGLQHLLDMLGIDLQLPEPRYNIAPTEDVLLLYNSSGEYARWWLTPSWAPEPTSRHSMFNAREETLTTRRAFKRPFQSQRGVVPMSSFIEWQTRDGVKEPWAITNEEQILAVAALWDVWERGATRLLSCTLITTEAADQFKPWHSRMPVMLTADELARWMDNNQEITRADSLFRPQLKFPLSLSPLSCAAGNTRNKYAEVMALIGPRVNLPHSD